MRGDEGGGGGWCRSTMPPGACRGRLDHDAEQDARATVTNQDRVSWRAPVRRAAMLLGGVSVPLGWLMVAPASGAPAAATAAATAPRTATVADSAEAWYADSPVDLCTTPLGCPPQDAPTSPYPADTLHVGVAGGQETARTYVLPDLV